jgi:lipopolysaccharide transport system permease protein
MMAVLGLGIGMIFSALTTKYRDLVFLLGFGIQLLMYITPVIYPLGKVSSNLSFFLKLNPLSSLIELFRFSFIGEGTFSFSSITYSIISAILLFVIGLLLFNKVEKDFMDTV